MQAFRDAVARGDLEAVAALLAEDVRFTSPVAYRPYQGRDITLAILGAVMRVFSDFRYVREIGSDGPDHVLVFEARVGERAIQGCDLLHVDDQGQIDDFVVMVRPLSAAQALAAAMAEQFDRIDREVGVGRETH
ncbi:MAG TPA: nuclear transport factor 2 family protein [Actinomycetes bacterium]|nr:nuclear transport factor 2 family protein [Actinomycetes bacterium]